MIPEKTTHHEPRVVVIGIGNVFRHDDAVGVAVARHIRQQPDHGIAVFEGDGDPAELMEAWEGASVAFLVDAAHSGAGPGTVYHFHVGNKSLPSKMLRCSTHDYGVSEAVELARALGKLPDRLIIYGIEGADFRTGFGLSPEVEQAADRVTKSILAYGRPAGRVSKELEDA